MNELLLFPAGKHDDQVDAVGLIGRMIDTMVGGRAPKDNSVQPQDRWAKAFKARQQSEAASSWKAA
jgi:hypothetical protein